MGVFDEPQIQLINDSNDVNDSNVGIKFVTKENWKEMKDNYPGWFQKEFNNKGI